MKENAKTCLPRFIFDGTGRPAAQLSGIIRPSPVTAFVGGGGKTHSVFALAAELSGQGARVIVTTTTHMHPCPLPLPPGVRHIGRMLPDGRLGPVDDPAGLLRECDYLLIEADGSRGLPVKAPDSHEPALIDAIGTVVAVQGLTAFGHPIGAVAHRVERVCALLGKTPDEILTPADGARLLLSPEGQRKGVGERDYAVILNQADDAARLAIAVGIAAALGNIPCAMTAYPVSN